MSDQPWWQRGAIYQIYPRSFMDSNGDGVGDLNGIRARLDHIASLRAEAVWLSPIFPSPMKDFGYDVADYTGVDPLFGSLAELDELIEQCHSRGLRVVLDWVPNHTSDQHPWFVESCSSRTNPRRDWYVWRDGRPDGGPPNDWQSAFRAVGSAWSYDELTGQWYLHSYMPEQPDLNWDNPAVEAAMHDVLRFWLDRGVDGFRLDAIVKIAKDPQLRDNAAAERPHHEDWDTIHERLRRIRRVVDDYDDRMIAGEVYLLDLARVIEYVNGGEQLHLAHNFEFVHLPWEAAAFRNSIARFEELAEDTTWGAWFLSNHDHSRAASRFNHDGLGEARARAAIVLLYALRGTPFVYQGEELALPDAHIPAARIVDVDGRDPERAPIPWQPPSVAGPGAGFTTGEPWLPVVDEAERVAVAVQEREPGSALALVREVAALRADVPLLREGGLELLDAGEDVLAWLRTGDDERIVVAINFGTAPLDLALDADLPPGGQLLLSSDVARGRGWVVLDRVTLAPAEAVLIRVRD